MARYALGVSVVCAVCLALPAVVQADWYDNFDDGQWAQDPNDPNIFDPNLWDPCNPHWTMVEFAGNGTWLEDANDGWLRLFTWQSLLYEYGALLGIVRDPYLDTDPNTSSAYFDDSAPHYALSQQKISMPNENGEVALFMHLDEATYWFYCADLEADDAKYTITLGNGPDWSGRGNLTRWDLDDGNGFWWVLQWEGDGDPNNSYLRSAAWNGGKYDWDGFWDIDLHVLDAWDVNNPDYQYQAGGICGCGCFKSEYSGAELYSDVKFDNFEVRWGRFGEYSPHTVTLKVKDANAIYVTPNYPHPDGGAKRLYPKGMVVMFEATCNGSKAFKKWTIKGPNDESDPLYQVIVDTNAILYLTIAGDYLVKATCKCGGGGIEPFAAMVLLVLGLTVVIRRLN